MFHRAIVKKPGSNFSEGLTTAELGSPDYQKTLLQHQMYGHALNKCGLELIYLQADLRYPDSTFVEDTAILTPGRAILTNPGADSRKGEVAAIQEVLSHFYSQIDVITAPGTVDGGDICEAGSHFFIGISQRTNEEGARQLAGYLANEGCTSSLIDIRGIGGILHLKSGIAYLGDKTLVLIDDLATHPAFAGYQIVRVEPPEYYAANCVRVNEYILLADGYPKLKRSIESLGYAIIPLDMSEFQKMDGGLSCLSLRF